MTLNTKAILKAAALYSALGIIMGGMWTFGDKTGYRPWLKFEQDGFTSKEFKLAMDQLQQNTLLITKGEFDTIWGERQFGELSFEKKVTMCKDAQILGYDVREDDGREVCTKDGKPVLTFKSTSK